MQNRSAAAVLAGVVVAVGLIAGIWQLSVDRGFTHVTDGDTVACGSAFGGLDDNPDLSDSDGAGYRLRCEDKLSSQRTMAFLIMGLGALGLGWHALTWKPEPPTRRLVDEEDDADGPAQSATT